MAQKKALVSMLSIPMIRGDDKKVLGVLNGFTTKPYQFCSTDINRMKAVANQAATTILDIELMVRNALIQEELQTHSLMKRACRVLVSQREMA
jgi:hypothetical protein